MQGALAIAPRIAIDSAGVMRSTVPGREPFVTSIVFETIVDPDVFLRPRRLA